MLFKSIHIESRAAGVIALVSTLALATILTGCSSSPTVVASAPDASQSQAQNQQNAQNTSDTPSNEDIAATAGELSVTEQEVSDFIKQWRAYAGVEEDSAFATLLDESGKTPSDIRTDAIDTLLSRKALVQKAQESGIEVNDEELDQYIADIKDGLGYATDDKGWKSTLDISGYDSEEQYRDDILAKMLLEKLVMAENPNVEASEVEMITLANSSLSDYTGLYVVEVVFPGGSGAAASRFASSLGSSVEDPEQFRAAAEQAVEAGSATEVVEAGWTCLDDSLSGAKTEALTDGYAGEIEMWQEDDGTYHVGYVAEVFAPKNTGRVDYQNMPADIKARLASDASAVKRATATSTYMDKLLRSLEVQTSDMPEDAVYNVDMTLSTYGEDDTLSEEEITASAANQIAAMENAGDDGANTSSTSGADE